MAQIDTILAAIKADWAADYSSLMSQDHLWFIRAEQPKADLSSFPYMEVTATEQVILTDQGYDETDGFPVRDVQYDLIFKIYTAQGEPNSSGSQITDQGNLQRALEVVLLVQPNTSWHDVKGLNHVQKLGIPAWEIDDSLLNGVDVHVSTNLFRISTNEAIGSV